MSVAEKIQEFIQLALVIAGPGGIPGIAAGILTFIQQYFPKEVQQEWTPTKIILFIDSYQQEQQKLLDEFNARRTEELPEEGDGQ